MKFWGAFILFIGLTCAASPMVTVTGILIGYNSQAARIRMNNNSVAVVPRSSVNSGHLRGLLVGKVFVIARVEFADLLRLNPKLAKTIGAK